MYSPSVLKRNVTSWWPKHVTITQQLEIKYIKVLYLAVYFKKSAFYFGFMHVCVFLMLHLSAAARGYQKKQGLFYVPLYICCFVIVCLGIFIMVLSVLLACVLIE